MSSSPGPQSVVERLAVLAAARTSEVAVVTVAPDGSETGVDWTDLADDMAAAARLLATAGVGPGDLVAVALPKCRQHFAATFGAWYLGARPMPLDPAMPDAERRRILDVARPAALVAVPDWADLGSHPIVVEPGSSWPGPPGPDPLPAPPLTASFAIATGGSSGRPKIILSPFPGVFVDTEQVPDAHLTGRTRDMVQLVNGPLHHNSPCTLAYGGLLWGHRLVVMERFEAGLALDLIERHAVSFVPTVPTVMRRLLDAQAARPRDLSSVAALFHTGASCPPAVKRGWIDLIGAERVFEAFGGSELIGSTFIRGDDWLERPGSVGRPVGADLLVLDEDGSEVAPGVVGEVFLRSHRPGPAYEYLGATSDSRRPDGFESLGDLGSVDADGFLFVADRRVDLIITGGANVYPAEVEHVLLDHPEVSDAVVVGVPDPDWGRRVHAVVCTRGDLDPAVLVAHCREHLSAYKVPKTVQVTDRLPRDPESGKIRRSAVLAAVVGGLLRSPAAAPSGPAGPRPSRTAGGR